MCDPKIIEDIDKGKKVAINKKAIQAIIGFIVAGAFGWLVTVIVYITDTNHNISNNELRITKTEKFDDKMLLWKVTHENNQDELLHNMKRLLNANGLVWEKFKPYN